MLKSHVLFHVILLYRRPIEGRIIHALGKTWHPEVSYGGSERCCVRVAGLVFVQHFVCAHCEKPFEGRRHFEKKGQAYCERDYKAVSCAAALFLWAS